MRLDSAICFWKRYKKLAPKDHPIVLKTGIRQSTLSTWKKKSLYPRADDTCLIADALNTSMEYLVTGQNIDASDFSVSACELNGFVKQLSEEGLQILKSLASDLIDLKYIKLQKIKKDNGHAVVMNTQN